jgi:hypothetical protein
MTTIIYKNANIFKEAALPKLMIYKIIGDGCKRICIKIDGESDGYVALADKRERLNSGEAYFNMQDMPDGTYTPRLITASRVLECAKFKKEGALILFAEPSEEELAALSITQLSLAVRLGEAEAKILALEEKIARPEIFKIG